MEAAARPARARLTGPIGPRIRELRLRARLTQAQLAGERYTGSYISALEKGLVRPSMAALMYVSERLHVPMEDLVRDQAPRWDRLEADLLLAAGEWQAAADRFTDLLDRTPSRIDAALLHRGRAEALLRLGNARDALADAAPAYEALKASGHDVEAAYAGYWLAYAHYQLDNAAEARAIAHQLLAEVRAGLSVQADFKRRLLVALASIETWEGRHDRALAFLEEARDEGDAMDARGRASLLTSLALAYADARDHEGALRAGMDALALFEAADAEREVALLRNALALTHLSVGNLGRASELVSEARALVEQQRDRRLLAHVAETEAQIALASGDDRAAFEHAHEALDLAAATGNTHAEASTLLTLARTHRKRGELADAEKSYARGADLLRRVGPKPKLQEMLREWAELLVGQDRHQEAVRLLQEALEPSTTAPAAHPRSSRT